MEQEEQFFAQDERAPESPAQPMRKGLGEPQDEGMTAQLAQVLDPEEQKMHNEVYGMAVALLYSPQFREKAGEIFERAPTPAAAATSILVAIGAKVFQAAKDEGMEISSNVLASSSWMVMQELAEFSEKVVGQPLSDEQIEAAFYAAADRMQPIAAKLGNVRFEPDPEMMAQIDGSDNDVRGKIMSSFMPQQGQTEQQSAPPPGAAWPGRVAQ